MSGSAIALEVAAALREVAVEVGDGEFLATLIVPSEQPTNPWSPEADEPTESQLPAMVQSYPQSMIDGTLIQQNDRRVMLAANGLKPSTSHKLQIGSVVYRILSVKEVSPSGVALYYELQARV
jgi:hypothetical protein